MSWISCLLLFSYPFQALSSLLTSVAGRGPLAMRRGLRRCAADLLRPQQPGAPCPKAFFASKPLLPGKARGKREEFPSFSTLSTCSTPISTCSFHVFFSFSSRSRRRSLGLPAERLAERLRAPDALLAAHLGRLRHPRPGAGINLRAFTCYNNIYIYIIFITYDINICTIYIIYTNVAIVITLP